MEERKWRRLHKSEIRRLYHLSSTLLARHEVDERNAHKVSWTNYGRKYYFRKTVVADKI